MNPLDIESFRSKYSDITVTAVPSSSQNPPAAARPGRSNKSPCVEITRVPMGRTVADVVDDGPSTSKVADAAAAAGALVGGPFTSKAAADAAMGGALQAQKKQAQQISQDATATAAYANEYKQVMAKLEYTKYMQAQVQLLSMSAAGQSVLSSDLVMSQAPYASSITFDPNVNIVDKYSDLLAVISDMRENLAPTIIGIRGPRERLMRDIAHARVLVRECLIMIEQQEHEQPAIPPK